MESEHERVNRILQQQFREALERRKLASLAFQEASHSSSVLPRPDGTQKILNASREYSAALQAVNLAVQRRSTFLLTGITPDDLRAKS